MNAEQQRLNESRERTGHWKRWGPYVSERAWGTVREDYSRNGDAWDYFPHEQARSRAYRWNEDGIAGICDRHQELCFALALWNGRDQILKERLFGVSGPQGNHGEDVKEYYFYLDSTPTHSYMKFLYKYPQSEYPYDQLVAENERRGKDVPEFELMDTGIFDEDRYFDVFIEYAKADIEDICIRITVVNRGPEQAKIRLLPTLWFRNTWSWDFDSPKPALTMTQSTVLRATTVDGTTYLLDYEGEPTPLFTENETNSERLFNAPNASPYVKDAFHDYVVHGCEDAVNPAMEGTKAALDYDMTLAAGEERVIHLRLFRGSEQKHDLKLAGTVDSVMASRKKEADEFYADIIPAASDADTRNIIRQALAGLLWSKQFYHYVVREWLDGDPAQPAAPPERKQGRNHAWGHLYNADVISMPDKWEYPWYAAWDLAFHCVPMALVDPEFAKEQLILMLREWYMHPNGQVPAYEWALGDVNPPMHAWAAYHVYLTEKRMNGDHGDRQFLERVFQKLLLNFTWWVNRKDPEGQNVFQGGFLGLDNIGVFDRNAVLPSGEHIEQSDGTSWMAMYSLDMLAIALELADEDPVYEDLASKFWEHFIFIARAMNHMGDDGLSLWDEEDGFFYDCLHTSDGKRIPLRVRSLVGLIPLYAARTLEPDLLNRMPAFKRRLEWFLKNRPDLTDNVACMKTEGMGERRLMSIPSRTQVERMLRRMLDENEFLSKYGIRALSRYHLDHPYSLNLDGEVHTVKYEPAESSSAMFGGNSNWRGPIWMPTNYLLIHALRRLDHYYGPSFRVECPVGSGRMQTLSEVSYELSSRLLDIFRLDNKGRRPVFGNCEKFQTDPHWRDYIPFYEYFNGDNGAGVGANHQTGWTALVASLVYELSVHHQQTEKVETAA